MDTQFDEGKLEWIENDFFDWIVIWERKRTKTE